MYFVIQLGKFLATISPARRACFYSDRDRERVFVGDRDGGEEGELAKNFLCFASRELADKGVVNLEEDLG